jgi:hypothetical protein
VGRLDDVWISDQAATASAINAWYKATLGNYPPEVGSLEAHYTFDGASPTNVVTGTDATTPNGSPASGAAGIRDDAFSFDASNSEALVSGNDLPLGGSEVTLAAWVRYTSYQGYSRIYQVGAGPGSATVSNDGGIETLFDGGTDVEDIFVAANGGGGSGGNIGLSSDAWYFVVTVADGSNIRLHVFDRDGELDASPISGNDSRTTTNSGLPLTMMAGDSDYTTGRLDEVYAYSAALSETQVEDLYAASEPVEYPAVPQGSMEAYYPLDGPNATNLVTDATASVTGSPTTGVDGIRGDAWEFTASGDTGSTADALTSANDLPLDGSGATVAAWFRYTNKEGFARVYQVGGDVSTPGASEGYETIFNGGNDELFVVPSSGSDTGNVPVSPDTWHLVVTVADGSELRLHVYDRDGEVAGSPATGSRTASDTVYPLVMMSGDDSEPAGKLDEVYAYSRSLSGDEIDQLHAATTPLIGDPRVATPYGLNAATTTADTRVTIDGLEFANGVNAFTTLRNRETSSSTGDSIDTSNVSNSAASLYQTQERGSGIAYDLGVLNGTYDVTVHTAEIEYTSSGQRTFDVSVNGTQIESGLDIYDEVGHDAAYTTTATGIEVRDGTLTVETAPGSSTVTASAPSTDLELYYSLDGSTATNSETSTDASVTGDPESGLPGPLGSAFGFDGNDALTSGTDLPLNGTAATVGSWFRYTDKDSSARLYQVGGNPGSPAVGSGGYEILFDGSSVRVATPGDTKAITGVTLSPDTWYFVVTVVDGTDVRLHAFDRTGELSDSPYTGTGSRDTSSSSQPLVLMAGDGSYTTGRMDEVRAYSQALTASEVTTLYEASNDPPAVISGFDVRPS